MLAQHDIEVFRNRQDQMQRQMIEMNAKVRAMEQRVERLIKQRDAARERVKALESSRAVRIAARLRKLLRRG